MRIEAPSSLERLTETYLRGQDIRCLLPSFDSKHEYIVNGFDEDGKPVLGVWDSDSEIIISKIDCADEGMEDTEEVVKVSSSQEEEVYLIK